jgi:hypothetical protein
MRWFDFSASAIHRRWAAGEDHMKAGLQMRQRIDDEAPVRRGLPSGRTAMVDVMTAYGRAELRRLRPSRGAASPPHRSIGPGRLNRCCSPLAAS